MTDDGFIADRHAGENAILASAAALAGVFDALAEGPRTAREVTDAGGLDARAVSIVLPALVDGGYLREEEGRFAPTSRAREAFGGDAPAGGYRHWLHLLRAWLRLEDVLRTGEPVPDEELDGDGTGEDEDDTERFMAAMAAQPRERARGVAELLRGRAPEARTALDLGGGPGVYARALAEEGFRVTLLDRPEVIDHVADAYGLAGEAAIELTAGDFLEDPLPEGPFDVVLLSNITHIFDPDTNAGLLRRVRERMRPGGVVGVFDMLRGRSPLAPRFAVVMLVRTGSGNTYTGDAYRRWLREAGFDGLRIDDVDPERQLVTAEAV